MKQNRTLIGIAAVLAVAVIGVVLLTRPEPKLPTGAPTGATVAVPPEPAADPPAEPAQAAATSEPAPAEVPAEAPASSESQAAAAQAPAAQDPAVQAPESQAPAAQAPAAQDPAVQAPVAQAPAVQAPVAQAPAIQAPAAQAPTAQAPTAQAPAAQAPTAQAPAVQAPAVQAPVAQAPTARAPKVAAPAQVATAPKTAEAAPEVALVAPPAAPEIKAILPSFDVVRVERSGEAVIAGRAAPGSEVTLRVGNRVLGKVTADGRGQWVLVLDSPLGPGSYQLSLESRLPGGEVLLSENVVVVSVPRPQIAAAEAVAPKQAEVAAQPETMAEAAPALEQPVPEQIAPEQTAPEQTAPEQTAPEQTAPEQTAPEQTAPEQTAPEQTAPSQPAPSVAANDADSATQAVQATQAVPDTQIALGTQTAPPVAPSVQVAAAEPVAEPQASEPPASVANSPVVEPAATALQGVSALTAELERPLAVLMPRSGEGQIRVLQQAETGRGGLGEGTLVLETVDYDAQGRTQVGGRAEAGSRLVVYLDNRAAADAEAEASGHWEATLVNPISPGLHSLRVDQLASNGQVTARVETPFSRAAVLTALPRESAVIVQPGNSLWRISRRIYGEGLRFSVIYQANREQIRDPNLIYPGQIFVVPTTN